MTFAPCLCQFIPGLALSLIFRVLQVIRQRAADLGAPGPHFLPLLLTEPRAARTDAAYGIAELFGLPPAFVG